MPVLDWIGKKAVVNHHREVPYRLIHCDGELSSGNEGAENLLVQGDNLEALKALLPYYAGNVKCIYIDPPYNTGSEAWVYNDNVASPEIRTWLGKVVGREAEDLSRHDKWLCMMYPRIRLLRDFLPEDGVMLISIDDNALHLIRILMEEVFGQNNLLGTLVWEKSRKNDSKFLSVGHEYVLFYAKNKKHLRDKGTKWREVSPGMAAIASKYRALREKFGDSHEEVQEGLRYYYSDLDPDHPAKKYTRYNKVDSGGIWRDDNMSWPGGNGPRYEVIHPVTNLPCKIPPGGWRYATPKKMQKMIERGIVEFRNDHTEPPIRKTYLVRDDLAEPEEGEDGSKVMTSYLFRSALQASSTIESIFGEKVFEHTKDHEVLARLIEYVTGPDDLILDSFAGSASTGHAVLLSNKNTSSSRKFILVEMNAEICQNISAKRLDRVIHGYDLNGKSEQTLFETTLRKVDLRNAPDLLDEANSIAEQRANEFEKTSVSFKNGILSVQGTVAKKSEVPGLGGGFRYCRLGTALFNEFGDIDAEVTFPDLAAHIFFAETGCPLPSKLDGSTSLIGAHKNKAIYLLFSAGEPGFPREAAGNVLTPDMLASLPLLTNDFDGVRVVFAEGCTVSPERLKSEGVIFKQIPYQIEGA